MSIRIGSHEWSKVKDIGVQCDYHVAGCVALQKGSDMPEIAFPTLPFVIKLYGEISMSSSGHCRAINPDHTGYDMDTTRASAARISLAVSSNHPLIPHEFETPVGGNLTFPDWFTYDSGDPASKALSSVGYKTKLSDNYDLSWRYWRYELAAQWNMSDVIPDMFVPRTLSRIHRLTDDGASLLMALKNVAIESKWTSPYYSGYGDYWRGSPWVDDTSGDEIIFGDQAIKYFLNMLGGVNNSYRVGFSMYVDVPCDVNGGGDTWYTSSLAGQRLLNIPFTQIVYSNSSEESNEPLEEAPEEMRHATIGDL